MPSFHDSAETDAAPLQVWKLLYDPARFPQWWAGVGTVEVGDDGGAYTMYPEGYPEFPMAQTLQTAQAEHRVTVSCLVSDLRFEWGLEPLAHDGGTRITVDVEIPEAEAARLDAQRSAIRTSLEQLAALAALTVD
jgi:uncharacterized protein YndB with AHSA1/START domain